jgi:hypothetical protein
MGFYLYESFMTVDMFKMGPVLGFVPVKNIGVASSLLIKCNDA